MRCRTLAEEFVRCGDQVSFISREHPGNLIHLLKDEGFNVMLLKKPSDKETLADYDRDDYAAWLGVDQVEDAHESIESIQGCHVDWMIVDHYALDIVWESELWKHVAHIMVIDDIANRRHNCDVLLDQNLYEEPDVRYDDLVPSFATKLMGPKHALLRPEYSILRNWTNRNFEKRPLRSIHLFMGSSDPTNETSKALKGILPVLSPDCRIDVVVGSINPHNEGIARLCYRNYQIKLHVDTPEMARLMASSDLAIGAAGSSTWERCCLGLPSLVVCLAENQLNIASNLSRLGAHKWLGWGHDLTPHDYADALQGLDIDELNAMSEKASAICDGFGTKRVFKVMREFRKAS